VSPRPRPRRFRFAYGLTLAYVLAVLLVYLVITNLPPTAQMAATLFAVAVLLVITGATLIAAYTIIVDLRRRHEQLITLLTALSAPAASAPSALPQPHEEEPIND
jgi:drug/metabolite transporter (DMT)-like permease